VNFADVPRLTSVTEERGETTVVVETAGLREASEYLRDESGFNFLADITAADYLGWNERTVAGHWGHRGGRDINRPGSWGLAKKPEPKPKRFSVSYHLVSVVSGATRESPFRAWFPSGRPPTGTSARRTTSWGSSSRATRI
jgi:NADH:ubiquinone oxidoreductase subunit C